MINASKEYDLKTGKKLFTPKTTTMKRKNKPTIIETNK